jgi:hypothetical protein
MPDQSVKLRLDFASTVIRGISLVQVLDMHLCRNETRRARSFHTDPTFVRPLWSLCTLRHCSISSNIYAKYAEVSRQCRPVQKVYLNDISRFSPYLTGNALHRRYRAQPVNAVCCENHEEHTYTVRACTAAVRSWTGLGAFGSCTQFVPVRDAGSESGWLTPDHVWYALRM